MDDENENQNEETKKKDLMGGVPTEEPRNTRRSETTIPHKEEEKPQEQAEAKEDKNF